MFPDEFQKTVHEVTDAAQMLYRITQGQVAESLAAGLGYKTLNGMRTARGESHRPYSETALVHRLEKLVNPLTARATSALVDGYRLTMSYKKKPESMLDRETGYDIILEVTPSPGRPMPSFVGFRMPEFFYGDTDLERYRVDADPKYRVDGPDALTRHRAGRKVIHSRLIDGKWTGGLYIYDQQQRLTPETCLGSVRSALARTVLAQFAGPVAIDVYRPDTYQLGAWRVLMRVGNRVRDVFPDGTFAFPLPTLPSERFVIGTYDRQHQPFPDTGRFVDGVCAFDVTSNGMPEEANPVPMETVRDLFIQAVQARLQAAGVMA